MKPPSWFAAALAALVLSTTLSPASASFSVQATFPFGPAHLGVAFTDSVDAATALVASRYTIAPQGSSPALAVQAVQLQDNQRTVILTTSPALPTSASYTLTVSGVTGRHGEPLVSGGPVAFATPSVTVTGIADVHANISILTGQTVTVIGEVFMRAGSVTGTPSGYIQDGTGRGLNVFGSPLLPPLDTLGTVVQVTGKVALFFSTVELTELAATTLASSVPPLAPRVLSVPAAASAAWEGTYIQTTATLTGPPTASGSSHYAYPAADQGTAFSFRVRNSTGVNPGDFAGNERVTGAGAGSNFQGTYQVTVGVPGEFFEGAGAGDVTPPSLVSAVGEGEGTTVVVTFNEPVADGASVAGNYVLAPTASPGTPIVITAASVSGAQVTLTLATALSAGASYTLAVSHVRDASGNEIAAGSTIGFVASTPAPYRVDAAFPFGARYVGVTFTEKVDVTAAAELGHYTFTPTLSLVEARVQANGQTVILKSADPLPASTTWSLTVAGVPSATGDPLAAGPPLDLATGGETLLDIATIQENVSTYSGQAVTFIGQVTIPVGSRGGTPNGYVEDGSGRGINLFGGSVQGAVNQPGSVAKVTGTVTPYFTTTEITSYVATAIATGMPPLAARPLTIAEANSSTWEGTYIEVEGEITEIAPSGTSNVNYVLAEGASSITARVANGLGIPSGRFVVGDPVTVRGAGGAFQSTYQINVGNLSDFFVTGSGGPDVTPPRLVGASGDDGSSAVVVTFDEPVSAGSATDASHYTVTPAGGAAITVVSAALASGGRGVTLTLAASLRGGVTYTVAVSGVTDLAGNAVVPGTSRTFTVASSGADEARLDVPPRTLVRGMSRLGELMPIQATGLPGSRAVVRLFDLHGRLVKVLFDGKLPANGRQSLTWDARDDSFELVPAGLYVCHLLTTDTSGRTREARAPVVVAVRLQ